MNSGDIPIVSVLVPVYNVEKYLNQCLESIVNQRLKEIEIIIINDGSKDGSLKIINNFAKKDSRIKVIDKCNSGYGDSMNLGLNSARGKYIGIVESDDWIEPDMFETLYDIAEKDCLDIVRSEFFYYSTIDGDNNVKLNTSFVPHNEVISPRLEKSVFLQQPSIWANLYLRAFLIKNNINFLPTPGASYQDTSFSFKVYACATRFKIIDKAFYHYRVDGGSSSFQGNSKIYCICDEYEEIWKYVEENKLCDIYKDTISKMQFSGYKWNFNRLIHPYSEEFFIRWHNDFCKLKEMNLLNTSLFEGVDSKILEHVLLNICPKKDKPLVSVIVPVYNVEDYLPKCLDSIISQSLKDIEIICVDDGSTDDSHKILEYYKSKDSRIVLISKSNGGLSSARNAGLKIAKADYVGFVDADDWIEPSTYEQAYYCMCNVDLVCFGTRVVGAAMMDRRAADMEYYRIKYDGFVCIDDDVRLNVDVSAWNKLFSLKLIRENNLNFPVGKLYEDYSFYWRYISLCKNAYFIPEYKYNYLRREGSIMANTLEGSYRSIEHLEIFPEIFNFISNRATIGKDCINSMFLNCFWFAYINTPLKKKKKVLKLGRKTVNALDLKGDYIIDSLRIGKYEAVDPHRNYTFKKRWIINRLNDIEQSFGCDLSVFRRMFYDTNRDSHDYSSSVATTGWVQKHESDYGVERWITIFDCNSFDDSLNWGMKDGLIGKNTFPVPKGIRNKLNVGTELKMSVTLWGAETSIPQGSIHNDDRAIWGNAIFDGFCIYAISVDLHNSLNMLDIRAVNISDMNDYSEFCKILKIERRMY